MNWYRYDPGARRLALTIHVQPNAHKNEVAGLHGDALRVRIAAPPIDNKANAELVAYLRELLDVPASAVTIRRGTRGRRKVVEVAGGPELAARLDRLARRGEG